MNYHNIARLLEAQLKYCRVLQNIASTGKLMIVREKMKIKRYFVLQCHIPEKKTLKNFVSRPPTNGLRLYCTMIRYGVFRLCIYQ